MSELVFDRAATATRLRASLETIETFARLVPAACTHANPSWHPPDSWTPAMNLAHLVIYEERIANPVLSALAAGGDAMDAVPDPGEGWFYNDAVALSSESIDALLDRFTNARRAHIATVDAYDDARWNAPVTMLWNSGRHGPAPHSAAWVATKTFQHTGEHANAIQRAALFSPR